MREAGVAETIRIGEEDEDSGNVFGISPEPAAADLQAFPLDERGRALEAARRTRFPSAPLATDTLDAQGEAPMAPEAGDGAGEGAVEMPSEPATTVVYLPGGPGIAVVPLQHPFRFGEREVREFVVPPVTCGLKDDFAAGLVPDMITLVWRVTGEPVALIRALREPDDMAVVAAVRAVLPDDISAVLARVERIAELARLAGE